MPRLFWYGCCRLPDFPLLPPSAGAEETEANDIIPYEARMKDVDNASNAKRYLMNWAQSLKAQG